jgi:hypothetical protein
VGWLIALAAVAAIAYGAWEFRWYLRTLRRSLRDETDLDDARARREPELAGRR